MNSEKLYFLSVCFLGLLIPFPYIYSSVAIIVVCFFWLFTGIINNIKSIAKKPYLWVWIIFYLLHLISYTYSHDKGESLFDLESKLSFLILPLVIGTGPKFSIRQLRIILLCFIGAIIILAISSFGYSWSQYRINKDLNNFFYNNMVRITEANAVYVAWYTLIALFMLIGFSNAFFRINRYVYILMLILLQVYFLSLSARLLILIEALLILPYAYFRFQKNREGSIGLIFSSVVLAGMLMVALTENPISNRYRKISPSNTNDWLIDKNDDSTTQDFTNVTLRLFLWKTAYESIKENKYYYFGCGNGDVRENQKLSIGRYEKNLSEGNRKAELWKYNIHNMYLHSLYMLGIPGLALFVMLIFLPLFFRLPSSYQLFNIIFTITAALFMFIEASLQTQAGIVFFTFFSMLAAKFHYSKLD